MLLVAMLFVRVYLSVFVRRHLGTEISSCVHSVQECLETSQLKVAIHLRNSRETDVFYRKGSFLSTRALLGNGPL